MHRAGRLALQGGRRIETRLVAARQIGIVYNPRVPEAVRLAEAIVRELHLEGRCWVASATELEGVERAARDTAVIVSVGGDGTILRTQRLAAPLGIPVVGVNLGRLGFMTELAAHEALAQLPRYLSGEVRVEERAMLQATVYPQGVAPGQEEGELLTFHALNDVVVGRGAVSRMVRVHTRVDGQPLTVYRADALIVATATGSTGYNLSAGGPILVPTSRDLVLKPVASHLGLGAALVLPASVTVDLVVDSDAQAMLSVDGYVDLALAPGDMVRVRLSPHVARFLRAHEPAHYYATLMQRLGVEAPRPPRAIF